MTKDSATEDSNPNSLDDLCTKAPFCKGRQEPHAGDEEGDRVRAEGGQQLLPLLWQAVDVRALIQVDVGVQHQHDPLCFIPAAWNEHCSDHREQGIQAFCSDACNWKSTKVLFCIGEPAANSCTFGLKQA